MSNLHFKSEKRNFFRNLEHLCRLEDFIFNQSAKVQKKSKIYTLADLLLDAIKLDRMKAINVAIGLRSIGIYERERLIDHFDHSHLERANLKVELMDAKAHLKSIKGTPLQGKTLDQLFQLKMKVQEAEDEIARVEAKITLLPKRNTLPPDLWHEPLGFVFQERGISLPQDDPMRYPLITEKAIDLISMAYRIREDVRSKLRFRRQLNKDFIEDSWQSLRKAYLDE